MATLEQIADALRKADAAGNVEDARALANAYRQMQSQQQSPQDGAQTGFERANELGLAHPEATPPPEPEGVWQRGVLAPVEVHSETGAFRPAVPQALMDAWGAVTLPGDVYAGKVDPMSDEGMKRALDLSGLATVGAPTGARGLISPTGQVAPRQIAQAVKRDGLSAAQINQGVSDLGPAGIVADLGPSLQGLAMGVARTPGEGQSALTSYLRTRAFEARDRIQPQVDEILGPSLSTGQFGNHLRDLRTAVSPIYKSAFDSADPVDVAPIVGIIDSLIGQTVGTGQSRLRSIKSMFGDDGSLTSDPRILFAIRNEVDDLLDSPDVGRIAGSLRDIRAAVDAELAAKVPGIKDADARWQEIARQQEGFDEGRKIFKQGDEATDPRDLGPRLERGVLPAGNFIGPSGETFSLSQGARNELDRLIGTGSQNRTNLATAIRGDGSWNRQKLSQLFGEEKADQVIRLFDAEAQMAETERQAIGSSVTASATAAQKALEPRSASMPILEGPTVINAGNAVRRIAEMLTGRASESRALSRNEEIAEMLMNRGGWYENRMTDPSQLSLIRALLMSGEHWAEPTTSEQ